MKVYRASRTLGDVRWELSLVRHLVALGAPVAPAVGEAEVVVVDGVERACARFAWAPGAKPSPSTSTYELLGATAARIHAAADSFARPAHRTYDLAVLIDEQLARMEPLLREAGRWDDVVSSTDRLRPRVEGRTLDHGVCHIDLTLDNVHRDGDAMLAFDLDSAGACWRAFEPYGVLLFGRHWFDDWLRGYRDVRAFSAEDEAAVEAFAVLGDLRVVAWKLGLAESSTGDPLLGVDDLDAVVDGWLAWA